MKKILLILIFPLAAYHSVKAQNIGINTTGASPNASAMLDIVAADKGLLIPRVALTSTTSASPVTSPATSLLVYNTATAGTTPNDVTPGYYFWSGSAWTPLAGSGGTGWNLDGNSLTGIKKFGTITNHDVPFITNNTEKMRLFSTGALALGTTTLDATNPEKFLVSAGTTSSYNLMNAKGSINNYLQINIQNQSGGAAASSDLVATANNGSETANYVDLGINSNGYSSTGVLGGSNNAYLYSTGNDFVIGNASSSKNLIFFTNGTAVSDEKMRITPGGNVGIGNTSPAQVLDVTGNVALSGALMPGGSAGTAGYLLTSGGAGATPTWTNPSTLSSSLSWAQDGNTLSAIKKFGTISNHDIPFITNNTEKMRLFSTGSLAVGTTSLDGTNPEKLLISAGSTSSYNLINAKGSINNYLQMNIQNQSGGAAASSDVVATANNGSETANYVDLGINSNGYSSTGVLGGSNNAYLYSTGNDFVIGNASSTKDLIFFTNGTAVSDEKMRITDDGKVGIGNTAPAQALDITGNLALSGAFMPGSSAGTSGYLLTSAGAGVAPTWTNPTTLASSTAWALDGNTLAAIKKFGTISAHDIPFITNNTEKMRLFSSGALAIGTTTLDATNPEKLLVNAGNTSSYNLMNAKGSINNYMQINIQNQSGGNAASSDLVATANNGSETVNYVDLGINSNGYSSTGVLGGSNNGYLYSTGNDFVIGNASSAKDLIFFTNGTAVSDEKMRITSAGKMGIGNTSPAQVLDVTGNVALSGALMPGGSAGTSGYLLTSAGAGAAPTWTNPSSLPSLTGWALDGNTLSAIKKFGTISAHDIPFITNNTEKMRLFSTGGLAIGTATLDATNPEKLLVNAGTTTSYNLMNAKGSINNYMQINIQNQSGGAAASSDLVATANNGSETVNYVDLGINSNGYSSTGVLGGSNNAYLYSTGNDFVIGNASSSKDLILFTNGTASTDEKMRINAAGSVGIGTSSFNGSNPEKLLVHGGATTTSYNLINAKGTINNYLQMNLQNLSSGAAASSDIVATANNGTETANYIDMGINSSGYSTTGVLGGANNAYLYSTGNDFVIGNASSAKDLIFFTNGTAASDEKMRITSDGNVGIGTSDFDATAPEMVLIDAGTLNTAVSAVGNLNDFLEINVQNTNNGNKASSDLVATANNGTENSVYVDLGINSAGYANAASNILNGGNLAYLYANANDFKIGNGTPNMSLIFFTNPSSGTLGTNTANGVERVRITEAGNVGIGTSSPNSTLSINGSVSYAYVTFNGNITVDATNRVIIYNNTGAGGHTITLPAASTCAGRVYRLVNQGSANLALSQAVTTANGVTTTTLTTGTNFEILSDGSVWRKIN